MAEIAVKNKRLMLNVHFINEDGSVNEQTIDLDLVERVSQTFQSTVTEYPLMEGDSITDHMWQQPNNYSISGTLSNQGKNASRYLDPSIQLEEGESRVATLKKLFIKIQKDALIVDILGVFDTHTNYVLASMTWIEKNNSIDYTFGFKKVFFAQIEELVYEVSADEKYLPFTTEMTQLDITETFLDRAQINGQVIEVLVREELLDLELLGKDMLVSLGLGAAGVIVGLGAALAIYIGTMLGAATVPVAGWIIAAAMLIVLAIGALFISLFDFFKKKAYKVKKFEYFTNSNKLAKEQNRLKDFFGKIHEELDVLEKAAKGFSLIENTQQMFELSINGINYIFEVVWNNSDQSYEVSIFKYNTYGYPVYVKKSEKLVGISSLSEAGPTNNLLHDEGVSLYIINPTIGNPDAVDDLSDVTKFQWFATKMSIEEWNKTIEEVITNEIKM